MKDSMQIDADTVAQFRTAFPEYADFSDGYCKELIVYMRRAYTTHAAEMEPIEVLEVP